MKKRYWIILLWIVGIATWNMPLPKWIIVSVTWACLIVPLVFVYKWIVKRTDCGQKTKKQVKPKKHKQPITVDQDGIKWGDARW
jgi:hypothetical protein